MLRPVLEKLEARSLGPEEPTTTMFGILQWG